MAEQSTHFVKYRMKDSTQSDRYITFSSRPPEAQLEGHRHPLVSNLAENDTETANRVEKLIQEMTMHEKRFFTWLGADASHMESFINDPIGALRQALPDLSEEFFNELNSLPNVFPPRK